MSKQYREQVEEDLLKKPDPEYPEDRIQFLPVGWIQCACGSQHISAGWKVDGVIWAERCFIEHVLSIKDTLQIPL